MDRACLDRVAAGRGRVAVASTGAPIISGRFAVASSARIASAAASARGTTGAVKSAWVGQTTASSATVASSTSDGRLRCTGPGRPEVARRIALATSMPTVAVSVAIQAALQTGAAIST